MHLQGKFYINMIKLVIKSRFLPLNMDSFFDFKLKSCGSPLRPLLKQTTITWLNICAIC